MRSASTPQLTWGSVIMEADDAHLRDPSGVLYHDGLYHCYPTRVPLGGSADGYRGQVWHFAAPDPAGPWEDRGPAVERGASPDAFDGLATFTADATYDPDHGRWHLFYSAVDRRFTNERTVEGFGPVTIGAASAGSPDGPWEKWDRNPILRPGSAPAKWDGMRIDEALPLTIHGRRRLHMRGVSLISEDPFQLRQRPGLYLPAEATTWRCGYERYLDAPIAQPPGNGRGFEAYAYFPGPDGLLHLLAVDPFGGRTDRFEHMVSDDGLDWQVAEPIELPNPNRYVLAPHPVWDGPTPGTDANAIALVTQVRGDTGKLVVRLIEMGW